MKKATVLQIAVCEDNLADTALLCGLIEKSGIPLACARFESGEEFLSAFHAGMYDLIFMDIYMKGLQGIETAEAIREKDENVIIAFTTSSPDHTRESYRLNALKYIDKPVREKDVKEALELALMKRRNRPSITLASAGGEAMEIYLDTVIYFEHKNHVVELHTTGRVIQTSQAARLDELEKRLPSPPFTRCHRSYLINLDYVREADREENCFFMKNGDRADIRRGGFAKYRTEWLNRCLDKVGRD